MSSYFVIRFGTNNHGFYNSPRFFSNHKEAYNHYSDESAKCEGAVIIVRQDLQHWKLLNSWSCYDFDVIENQFGGFRVAKVQSVK